MDRNDTSEVIAKVTLIWQRVLQQPRIDPNDNFFDLGGDPASATQIFSEISRIFDRKLPPVIVYHTPTIAALAEILTKPGSRPFKPLLQLNAVGAEPSVFMAHGLGGDVMEFFYLVKHIPSPNAIYGMQAIDRWDKQLGSIEEMAQFFLDAIKEAQPHGPYLLMGYSLGGLVVLEMAQRFLASGERVSLLAMIETYPHMSSLSAEQRVRLLVQRGMYHASMINRLPLRQALTYFIGRAKSRLGISKSPSEESRDRPTTEDSSTLLMQRQRGSAYQAWANYRPRYYCGKIKFVRAKINSYFPVNPTAVWGNLAQEFEVEVVPGDHLGILTTNCESLGSVLYRYLREAGSGPIR